jgi:hypothetical protein
MTPHSQQPQGIPTIINRQPGLQAQNVLIGARSPTSIELLPGVQNGGCTRGPSYRLMTERGTLKEAINGPVLGLPIWLGGLLSAAFRPDLRRCGWADDVGLDTVQARSQGWRSRWLRR